MPLNNDPSPPSFNAQSVLLGLAAMFDGEFSLDWLEELTGMRASAVVSELEQGVEEGLLVRIRPAVYRFRRVSQRQEWLRGLGREEKEQWRRKMAAILIREPSDDDSKVLSVAGHLLSISKDWKDCEWLMRAGEIYAKSFRAEKAIACYSRVLDVLADQRGEKEDRLFVVAAMEHSNIFAGRRDSTKSLSLVKEARERAKGLHEPSYEILLEMHIAKYERLNSEFSNALGRFERAYSMVEKLNNPELSAAATAFHTYFLFWQGRFRDVVDVYERSVPEVDRYPVGRFPLIAAMMVGHCYAMVGQVTQGLGMLDAIRNYCLQAGDRYLSSHAGACIAMVMLLMSRLEDALRYLRPSLKEADESDNRWVSTLDALMLALVFHLRGDDGEAVKHLRAYGKVSATAQANSVLLPYLLELCWVAESGRLPSLPGFSLEREIDRALSLKNVFLKGIALRYSALLGASKGAPSREIVRLLSLSTGALKDSGNQFELARTYLELTRYYVAHGNRRRGKAAGRMASRIFAATDPELIPDDLRALAGDQKREEAVLAEIFGLTHQMGAAEQGRRIIQQIVATVNRLIGAERGALLLVNEESREGELQLRASKNLTIEQIHDSRFSPSRAMIDEVIASGKGRIFDVGGAEDASSPTQELIRSSICAPLTQRGRIVGVLYHENRLLGNVFREWHLDLLTYFADLAALDLERESAHREIERLTLKDPGEGPLNTTDTAGFCRVEGAIGSSPPFQEILSQIDRIAGTDTNVLILGETGVGKNLFAEAIHRRSLRREGPFVTVQCSALTESLITSELFGHEKGAFTGATDRRIGRFEMANKGTLFLDEIGDLSLDVQARLLRVLQSKEFERVGGGKDTLTSDFRLLAATNRDLEEEVRAKRFREDLYYRINVFPLHIPPLRERREDIPLIAHHFLESYGSRQGATVDRIPREAMEVLMHHDWPGNVRELENVIQRGVVLSAGSEFRLPPLGITPKKATGAIGARTLEENERGHILEALQTARWKIRGPGGAAENLGVNPSTLRSRMKKLDIVKPPRA